MSKTGYVYIMTNKNDCGVIGEKDSSPLFKMTDINGVEQEIPHFVRNDTLQAGSMGRNSSGIAAAVPSPFLTTESPSFRRSEATEETNENNY